MVAAVGLVQRILANIFSSMRVRGGVSASHLHVNKSGAGGKSATDHIGLTLTVLGEHRISAQINSWDSKEKTFRRLNSHFGPHFSAANSLRSTPAAV